MKRVVSVFFCLIFSLSLLMLRLYLLANDTALKSGNPHATLTVEAASGRGTIYDRDGRPFVNETTRLVAVVPPVQSALTRLRDAAQPAQWAAAYERLAEGLPAVVRVETDVTGEGIRTIRVPVRYGAPFLIPHLAGYCDGTGEGVCGLEKSFASVLETRTCTVTFPVNAVGRILPGKAATVRGDTLCTSRGVVLTLDRELQRIVRQTLLDSAMEKGAAVLLDAPTGEILAMVSLPEFDVTRVQDSLDDLNAPFINRALNAVSVGSVYKMLVAAAALESGVSPDTTYTCTGEIVRDGVTFHCHLRTGHGTLDLRDALFNSCNPWFIRLAERFPLSSLLSLSTAAGFGAPVTLAPDLTADAGNLPTAETLPTDAARANLAFGQGALTASPLQIAAATAAIANGGVYRTPRLVLFLQDDDGRRTAQPADAGKRILRAQTAKTLREMLVYCARNTPQFSAFHDCGGKTATAQTGVFRDSEELLNAWYSGFFPADDPQFVLTILYEDGTSGTRDCIPIFEKAAVEIEKTVRKRLQIPKE